MTYQLNFSALWPYLPELLSGLLITIELTAIATLGGSLWGLSARRSAVVIPLGLIKSSCGEYGAVM